MRDVDALLRATQVPEAPARPPDPRRRIGSVAVATLIAAAAASLLWVLPWRPGPSLRGRADPRVAVSLQVAVERGGVAVRATEHGRYRVGEQAFFRISASKAAHLAVWVEGPRGREDIGGLAADARPRDLGDATGLTAFRFDQPGTFTFGVSGPCEPGCPALTVEVE